MNFKKFLVAACSVVLACGMAGCSGSGSNDSSNSGNDDVKKLDDKQQEQVTNLESKLPERNLSNTEIKWMAHYDINPSKGQVEDPGLALFKSKYKGSIKYVQTTWDNRYTDLAKAVMANNSPDFFPASDMDAFPGCFCKSVVGKMISTGSGPNHPTCVIPRYRSTGRRQSFCFRPIRNNRRSPSWAAAIIVTTF